MNRKFATILLLSFLAWLVVPVYSSSAEDRLAVLDQDASEVFRVTEDGDVYMDGVLLANGARLAGGSPMVLKQTAWNRGVIITDNEQINRKKISIGWNVGESLDYMEILAVQEGVAFKNIVLAPSGGNVGIATTSPSYRLDVNGYVSATGYIQSSSRDYKKDIRELSGDEAMDALGVLRPVKFRFKKNPEEKHVGFISEDVPDLVASKDRKGMSSMDVVAVLTKVVQEQQTIISKLSKEMDELKKELRKKETSH